MRRGFSIFLILLFGLGPVSATLDGSEDAKLPSCCRRHGAHRCAMAATMAKAEPGSTPDLTAPSTCPNYPGMTATLVAPVLALLASPAKLPAPRAHAHQPAAQRKTALSSPVRAHAGRGPPAENLI